MIKSGDFVKLHYTGKLSDGTIFDTTDEEIARKAGFEGKNFRPAIICVGERMLVPGLDSALIGKSVGKSKISLSAKDAFGIKDPKLIKIVPVVQLNKQNIRPLPGLRLNVDGSYGIVRSVNSGRAVIDFNHPLASQDVVYDVEILAIIDDVNAQIRSLLDATRLPYKEVTMDGDSKATISLFQMLPRPILDALTKQIVSRTACKTVSYEIGSKPAAAKPVQKNQEKIQEKSNVQEKSSDDVSSHKVPKDSRPSAKKAAHKS